MIKLCEIVVVVLISSTISQSLVKILYFGEVWASLDKHQIRKMGKEAKRIRKGNKNFEDMEEEKVGSRIRGRLSANQIFFFTK